MYACLLGSRNFTQFLLVSALGSHHPAGEKACVGAMFIDDDVVCVQSLVMEITGQERIASERKGMVHISARARGCGK